jgi:hypothetical protein
VVFQGLCSSIDGVLGFGVGEDKVSRGEVDINYPSCSLASTQDLIGTCHFAVT